MPFEVNTFHRVETRFTRKAARLNAIFIKVRNVLVNLGWWLMKLFDKIWKNYQILDEWR